MNEFQKNFTKRSLNTDHLIPLLVLSSAFTRYKHCVKMRKKVPEELEDGIENMMQQIVINA